MNLMPDAWDDDDRLLASLRQALDERRAVPPDVTEFGRHAFAWYAVNTELAELIYDSRGSQEPELSLRAETANIRALTFRSPHLVVEMEVTAGALVGQVVPAQSATVTVQPGWGAETTLATEELGCFSIEPVPTGMLRLSLDTVAGIQAVTSWFEL
jgi:hypothetical protein